MSIEAFSYTKIEKVIIPKSLTRCGERLFENSELKEAVLPDEMTEIPYGIFQFADKLTKVNVPSKLTTIGGAAFDSTNVDVKKFLENKNLTTWLGGMLEFRSDFKNAFTDLDVYNFKWNKKKKRREVYIKWHKSLWQMDRRKPIK